MFITTKLVNYNPILYKKIIIKQWYLGRKSQLERSKNDLVLKCKPSAASGNVAMRGPLDPIAVTKFTILLSSPQTNSVFYVRIKLNYRNTIFVQIKFSHCLIILDYK